MQAPVVGLTHLSVFSVCAEWCEKAKKELKTVPLETLDWHTAEVSHRAPFGAAEERGSEGAIAQCVCVIFCVVCLFRASP